jgi:hypothetical protein
MDGPGAAHREGPRGLLSRLGRCITLAPLSGARPSIELAGETGSRCELLNPGAAPATVCESRRILKSLRPQTVWEDIRRP